MASAVYIFDLKGKLLISRDYRGDTPAHVIQEIFIKRVIAAQTSGAADEASLDASAPAAWSAPSGGGSSEDDPYAADDWATLNIVTPLFYDGDYSFVYVMHRNIYVCLVSKLNANAMMMTLFLHRIVEVFTHYFKELEEESVKDNFVVVYELLDEMMDYGYPQSTETKILQEFIKNESHKLNIDAKALQQVMQMAGINLSAAAASNPAILELQGMLLHNINLLGSQFSDVASKIGANVAALGVGGGGATTTTDEVSIPKNFTQTISWRKEGLMYKKNECFLDVVESLNVLVSATGQTLRSDISGELRMRCLLSGMPELKLGLNDKVLFENMGRSVSKGRAVDLEDIKFHQCVRLNRFEQDRTISFVPPDGDFVLMNYRLATRVKPLILVESQVEIRSPTRIEFVVRAKAQFKNKSIANNVQIFVPVPRDADSPSFKASMGTCDYVPDRGAIVWSIKQFPGGAEFLLRAQVDLPSTSADAEASIRAIRKRPIEVKFEIPYFTVSGLAVRFLKIMESKLNYTALPWVRYLTTSGSYEQRQSL